LNMEPRKEIPYHKKMRASMGCELLLQLGERWLGCGREVYSNK